MSRTLTPKVSANGYTATQVTASTVVPNTPNGSQTIPAGWWIVTTPDGVTLVFDDNTIQQYYTVK